MRLGLLAVALVLLGCTTPTESDQPCGPCAASLAPPAAAAVSAAIEVGREQAARTCDVRTTAVPPITWWRCRTQVYGHDTPGGPDHSVCAAGMTRHGIVYVSLDNPSNTLALVTWESRNWYWIESGCSSQAY